MSFHFFKNSMSSEESETIYDRIAKLEDEGGCVEK